MIIWVCKVYAFNSKSGKQFIDPSTSTDFGKYVGPLIPYNIPHKINGYFMLYANTTKVLLYYDTHT